MMMTGGAQQSPATLMESSRKREILEPSRGVAAKHTSCGSLNQGGGGWDQKESLVALEQRAKHRDAAALAEAASDR